MDMLKKILRSNRFTGTLLNIYALYLRYLKNIGWLESTYTRNSVTLNGDPIPWISYSALDFLNKKMQSATFDIFEYGSGNSTIWFAKRAKKIISVEHDSAFYNFMKDRIEKLPNTTYIHKGLEDGYSKEVLNYKNAFDLVVIDGRERVLCAKNSIGTLKKEGIILWDNSEREKYKKGYNFLLENGFKAIDFVGLAPMGFSNTQTTVFYKENNCFGI